MTQNGIGIDMDRIERLSEEQKKAFLHVFCKMASVDGQFDDCEKEFIRKAAADFGINREETEDIINNLDESVIITEAALITDRQAALELIKELCVLAHADDNMSDDETLFIGQIGQAMGIELSKIEEISNWVIDYLIWSDQGKIIFEKV